MNIEKLYELLEKFITNENIISIKRERIDPDNILATPLVFSQRFLLIVYWYDFFFGGYKIIRINDITDVVQGASELFLEKIYKEEKIIENHKNFPMPNMLSWQQIFKWLFSLNLITIIENEGLDNSDFHIGKILNTKSDTVEISEFDGAGRWIEDTSVVDYENISCVTVQDRYSELMGKYAGELGGERS